MPPRCVSVKDTLPIGVRSPGARPAHGNATGPSHEPRNRPDSAVRGTKSRHKMENPTDSRFRVTDMSMDNLAKALESRLLHATWAYRALDSSVRVTARTHETRHRPDSVVRGTKSRHEPQKSPNPPVRVTRRPRNHAKTTTGAPTRHRCRLERLPADHRPAPEHNLAYNPLCGRWRRLCGCRQRTWDANWPLGVPSPPSGSGQGTPSHAQGT